MKHVFDPCFIGYAALWCIVHHLRSIGVIIPVINDQLTDFLAVPAIAHLSITVIRNYVVNDHTYTYPPGYVLIIALYLSVVFEWMMPELSPLYTGDGWDVVAYGLGAVFYYFVHGKLASKKEEQSISKAASPLH